MQAAAPIPPNSQGKSRMRTYLMWTAAGFVVVVLLALGIAMTLPSTYRIERSTTIAARTSAIHAIVGDLSKWPLWEPWSDVDPSIQVILSKQTRGVGAAQRWEGKQGQGSLVVVRSSAETGLAYTMKFEGRGKAQAGFDYQPTDASENGIATEVRWWMEGDYGSNLLARFMVLGMDGWLGPMFEKGLDKLKDAAETYHRQTEDAAKLYQDAVQK